MENPTAATKEITRTKVEKNHLKSKMLHYKIFIKCKRIGKEVIREQKNHTRYIGDKKWNGRPKANYIKMTLGIMG